MVRAVFYRLGMATLVLILLAAVPIVSVIKLVGKLQQREPEAIAASAKLGAIFEGFHNAVIVTDNFERITEYTNIMKKYLATNGQMRSRRISAI